MRHKYRALAAVRAIGATSKITDGEVSLQVHDGGFGGVRDGTDMVVCDWLEPLIGEGTTEA